MRYGVVGNEGRGSWGVSVSLWCVVFHVHWVWG